MLRTNYHVGYHLTGICKKKYLRFGIGSMAVVKYMQKLINFFVIYLTKAIILTLPTHPQSIRGNINRGKGNTNVINPLEKFKTMEKA